MNNTDYRSLPTSTQRICLQYFFYNVIQTKNSWATLSRTTLVTETFYSSQCNFKNADNMLHKFNIDSTKTSWCKKKQVDSCDNVNNNHDNTVAVVLVLQVWCFFNWRFSCGWVLSLVPLSECLFGSRFCLSDQISI